MTIPLTAIAGAFEQLSKRAEQFDKLDEQRRLLAFEMQRTAPEGYQLADGADGRPTLKYVGMQDPRIQTKLASERQQLQIQQEAQLNLARQLEPIKMQSAEAEIRLRNQLEQASKVYLAGVEASTEFAASAGQLANPAFLTLPPDKQSLVAGEVAMKFAAANALAPDRAQATLAGLPESARAFLGGSGGAAPQGQPAGQPAPQGLQLPPSGLDVGPGPSAPGQPAAAQPAPAQSAAAAPQRGAQPASGIEVVLQGLRRKLESGVSEADARAEAVQILQSQAGAEARFGALKAGALDEGTILRLVNDTIRDVQEAPQRARETRMNEIQGRQLASEEAASFADEFLGALSTAPGSEDRLAPYLETTVTETAAGGKQTTKTQRTVNEAALEAATRGDAEPIARLRAQVESLGLSPEAAVKTIGADWGNPAAKELAKFEPRRMGDTLILTPQKGSALQRDPNGPFRLTGGKDDKIARLDEEARKRAEASRAAASPERRAIEEAADAERVPRAEGLTPGGLAELVWAATHAENGKLLKDLGLADRQLPRFIWINAPIRGLDADTQKRLVESNEEVFRAMGRRPKQGGGVWLDVSRDLPR